MTLVVARIVNDEIHIESDTKITDLRLVQPNPLCGFLKTLIVHPSISISFAGNVHFAEVAISRFYEQRIEDLTDLLNMLNCINSESNNSTDFIVGTILGGNPRLFKISDGVVKKDVANAWIGDFEGFDAYQTQYHNFEESLSVKDRMKKAFEVIVKDPSLSSIGDFHISTSINRNLCPTQPIFLHDYKVSIEVTEPQTIEFDAAGEWESIPFGTTEGGSHGLSQLVTVSPRFHGVAIHFRHGNFGLLFCPQLEFKGILIKDVNGKEFISKIKEEYGIPLRGFLLTTDESSEDIIECVDSRDL